MKYCVEYEGTLVGFQTLTEALRVLDEYPGNIYKLEKVIVYDKEEKNDKVLS